jgi:hypothetical protein
MQVNSTIQVANAAAVQVSVPDTSWHEIGAAGQPAFQNGWANFGGGTNTAAYRKDALGFVHLKGSIASGTLNAAAFTLTVGYRPAGNSSFACVTATGFGNCTIRSPGTVTPVSGTAAEFLLDVITFYAGP